MLKWFVYMHFRFSLVSILAVLPFSAQAALQRVGPVNPGTGYPAWYQDASGLVMDFCSPTNTLELSGGWCLLLPPVPSVTPEIYPPPAQEPQVAIEIVAVGVDRVGG